MHKSHGLSCSFGPQGALPIIGWSDTFWVCEMFSGIPLGTLVGV